MDNQKINDFIINVREKLEEEANLEYDLDCIEEDACLWSKQQICDIVDEVLRNG